MSKTLDLVRVCVAAQEVRVSRHGVEELNQDGILLDDVLASAADALLIEDYVSAGRGPSVLALHRLRDGSIVHVVWAFLKGTATPAVLVTAYRPDPERWSADFTRRRP